MSELRDRLRAAWSQASATPAGGHEWRGVSIATPGAARARAAVREPDERIALLLEVPLSAAPHVVFRLRTDGVSVSDQRRPDENIMRLAVTLERPDMRDIFEVLVCDLVEAVAPAETPGAAIEAATRRLDAWQACLRSRGITLSKEEQLGLVGELATLAILAERIGFAAAVDSWKGPLDGLHDFSRNGSAIETKSAIGNSQRIYVTALNQLDATALSLVLLRPRFREAPTGLTLPEHVSQIRSAIDVQAPGVRVVFDDLLLRARFVDGQPDEYGTFRVTLDSAAAFAVSDDFPAMPTGALPAAIVGGAYVLDEQALTRFLMDEPALELHLASLGDTAA
jgi:hypothetical protein